MEIVQIATYVFSILAIICQISIVLILLSLFIQTKVTKQIILFFGTHALLLGFLIALIAMLGSLFYSEIAHYVPCKLCWYQRILMYPQVILLGIAYVKKDKGIALYSMILSGIGAMIAAYHYLLQTGTIQEILPCTTVGYSVSCAEKFVMTYGYLTIPFMALSGFFLIFLLMILQRRNKR